MRSKPILIAALAALLGMAALAGWWFMLRGQAVSSADTSGQVERIELANGMEVLLVTNHRVPAISHTIWYRVGSADDPAGQSGLAHYVEHMMFKGTPSVPVGEFSRQVTRLGGKHNAFTGYDFTGYYVDIAREHLPLVMQMEADRMRNLNPSEEEFLKERDVILEERRSRIENNPAAQLREEMQFALFHRHPYRQPVIGWMDEMERLTREQVMAFYHTHYHPGNAVVVIAGDSTREQLMPLLETYYARLNEAPVPQRHWLGEPKHRATVRVTLSHALVKQPRLYRRYLAPSLGENEQAEVLALSLMAELMGGSDTSLLYQSLVQDKKLAVSADISYGIIDRGPSTFDIALVPAPGVSLEQLEQALDAELTRILAQPVQEADLARLKTKAKAEVIYARDSLRAIADFVGQLRMVGVSEAFYENWPQLVDAITGEAMLQAARQTLLPEQAVTGWLLPQQMRATEEAAPEQGGEDAAPAE